jgi:fructose-1-phosphate kinase PfkB-like protein
VRKPECSHRQVSSGETLRLGAAAGTANALSARAGRFRKVEVEKICNQIEVHRS